QQHQTSRSYSPAHPRVHWVGRTAASLEEVRVAWSGSGFVARFFGTGLSATCRDGGNVYTIIVDGAEPRVLTLKPGRFAYQFASQLPCDVHTVEVYRRTEPMLGPTSFGPLQVEGQQPNAHRDSHAYDDLGD